MSRLIASLLCSLTLLALPAFAAEKTKTAKPKADKPEAAAEASAVYKRISQAYLDGKWDDLEKLLRAPAKELAAMSAAERAEVVYIRRAVGECREPWWKQTKAGQPTPLRTTLFGKPLNTAFNPAGKGGVEMKTGPGGIAILVSWPAADMDNPAHAEHGFSKGDLNSLSVWATLGMAQVWSQMSPQALAALTERDKLRLVRYQDFRGNLAGLYYGTPRARRWGEFLYMLMWLDKYKDMPIRNSRKACAAMFLAEFLTNPAKYPSLTLPDALVADGAEEKLAQHVRTRIEKHGWTVAEDKTLREAINAFAKNNDAAVYQTETVTLPNKLKFALDPEADAALRPKRDAWLKAQFDKQKK